tara:strand:- start:1939 stop:3198 length:1260 start_codon:yes stop_codon:yes gene_type:complete
MVDILPPQTRIWQEIESLARKHFRRAALEEIRTPILESTELFTRGIGEGTDVVGKEMYSFLDRGDRSCTLRPEGTASVVRSIIQNGLINKGPQRLWYGGPMFRYERPQAGRQRQFHQIGVELFGFDSIQSDAELIIIGWDLLKDIGLGDLTLELNTLGNSEDRKQFRGVFVSWLEDHIHLLDDDSKQRLKRNPLRILDSKNSETQKLLKDSPSLKDSLCPESLKRFEDLIEVLNSQEIPFKVNFGLVRGLDYYCHTAFEIKSEKLGAQSTICGGGRYDGLVKQLGGPDISSIGWAIGMERLILLAINELRNSYRSLDVYLINRGDLASKYAIDLSRKLRAANFSVQIDYTGSTFSKQFKRADRSGASWAIVLGDNEIIKNSIKLKKLNQDINLKNEGIDFNLLDLEKLINFMKSQKLDQ